MSAAAFKTLARDTLDGLAAARRRGPPAFRHMALAVRRRHMVAALALSAFYRRRAVEGGW